MRESLARGRAEHETSMTIVILPVADSFGITLVKHCNSAMALL